jgi:hypothetical protein
MDSAMFNNFVYKIYFLPKDKIIKFLKNKTKMPKKTLTRGPSSLGAHHSGS